MTANSCFHSISLFASFNMSPYVWSSTLYGRDAHLNTFAVNENCYCTGFFIYICSIISCNSSVCHAILSMPWLIYITFMEQLCLFWSSGCWMDTRLCCDTDSTAARYMTLRLLHHCCVGYVYYYSMLYGLCGLLVYAIWSTFYSLSSWRLFFSLDKLVYCSLFCLARSACTSKAQSIDQIQENLLLVLYWYGKKDFQ